MTENVNPCIEASSIKERLIGAKDAEIGEFPFAVSIRSNNKHFCSGALITKRHVLTVAHCVFVTNYMFGSLIVVVGTNSVSTGGKSYRISHSYQHPDFEFQDLFPDWMYDIGIFKGDSGGPLTQDGVLISASYLEVSLVPKAIRAFIQTYSNIQVTSMKLLTKVNKHR
ncbi:serine protease 55-like [Nasonia vitripennis]|uniref:Peptidase S1 domain-containing protein n=1 Tax=Nasonia vitripennis TaxID=7425 RepID=A0A7M7QMH4_NASVI|nr:serine protease 55-like [Nasonia vitripennis]